jgi:hypothetical protein
LYGETNILFKSSENLIGVAFYGIHKTKSELLMQSAFVVQSVLLSPRAKE